MFTGKWQVHVLSILVLGFVLNTVSWCLSQPNARIVMAAVVLGTLVATPYLKAGSAFLNQVWLQFQTRPSRKNS